MAKVWTSRGLLAAALLAAPGGLRADAAMDGRIAALVPDLEAEIAGGMQDFDVPGLAVGIVSGDRLVYGKGFGVGRRGGPPVDTDTVFQIGSTTKAFLATTLAIAVDRGALAWDDRVVDRYPGFQLKDPWASQEFRLLDLLAQRSGLPPYANDFVGLLGGDQGQMIHSLRYVEPVTSFRSHFAYTNITHMVAQNVAAEALGAADWPALAQATILDPLGMSRSSFTAEAIETADNSSVGHRYEPAGSVEIPFTPLFPYGFGGAGAINSTVDDLVPWLRLHLGRGTLEGEEIVSAANLAATKTARVGINDSIAYAMGWLLQSTPNGMVTWHNGGTSGYGAYVGTALDHDLGVVVLTNQTNVGMPDALGAWIFDRLLGNPEIDHLAQRLEQAKAAAATEAGPPRPADPAPPPPLASLAGTFASGSLGKATLSVDGEALAVALDDLGAGLRLEPWDGDILSVRLVPEGRFEPIADALGPYPLGLVQFVGNADGARDSFTVTMTDGQTVRFDRTPAP